ncbi:unnamed protein product [Paramecium octaurelia]|uniref:Transmembrane protein n=1 Tax=Paramecium octaurelia TaxID=43137 RepID=A0A8S1XX68_PAROT|nr:unnamed protein product [Paramecium octaurelia]
MNKFTLFFLDKRIEDSYQAQSLQNIRMTHFNLLSKGYLITFIIRCITFLLSSDFNRFYPNLSMLLFFIVVEIFFSKHNLSLRVLSIIANHLLTIFFYLFDEETDVATAHLKGVNQMGSNFLITIGSEFPEALFQVISITGIRIYFVLQQSKTVSLYPISSLILVSVFYLFFHYKFNEAMRAQFMLIQKDQQWETILRQLIDKQTYVMLNFNENSFHFEFVMARNFQNRCMKNKEEILNFFKEAQYNKKSLNDYLYEQMKQYQKTRIDIFRKEIFIKKQREMVKLEFSIFFGNQASILLIFHKPKLQLSNVVENVNNKVLFQYLVKLLNCFNKKYKTQPSYINLMKKIHLIEIYQNLQNSWENQVQEINLQAVISEQIKYFSNIILKINSKSTITMRTNKDIISLILFKIFSNTNTSLIKLRYTSAEEEEKVQLRFHGSFNCKDVLSFFTFHKEHISRFGMLTNITNSSYLITFIIRCITFLLSSDFNRFYPNLSMLLFFIVVEIFFSKHNLSLRVLSIIANHLLTIFFYLFDEETDVATAHLKGVNQMGSNFLITIGSEFPEALFQVISITGIRIYFVLQQSKTVSLYPISSLILVSVFYLFFHYKFNEAMRAQFMLIQKDQQWETILRQLIDKQTYVMLNFNENSFHFEFVMARNFQNRCMKNKEEILNFFKEAQYNKKSLNDYLYEQMKQYQKTRIDIFRKEIFIKKQREMVKLEFSIFFGNQASILLIFHKPKLQLSNVVENVNNKVLFQYLVKLLNCFNKKYKTQPSYINLMKKIHLIEIYQNLQNSWENQVQEINLQAVISEQIKYFSNIILKINSKSTITMRTNKDIISLILFKIFSNTNTSLIKLRYTSAEEEEKVQLRFHGSFNCKDVLSFFTFHKEHISRFGMLTNITNSSIFLYFEKNPYVPFTGKEKYQQTLEN